MPGTVERFNGRRARSIPLRPGLVDCERRRNGAAHVVVVDHQIGVSGLGQKLRWRGAEPAGAFVLAVHDDLAREPPVTGGVQRRALLDRGIAQPGGLVAQQRPRGVGDGDLLLARDQLTDLQRSHRACSW